MLRALVFWLLLASVQAWGQVAAPDVTIAQLDAAVDRATASMSADDPQRAALLKTYADARTALSNYEQFNAQMQSYAKARASAVKDAEAIEAKLAEAHNAPAADDSALKSVSLAELEQMLQVQKSELEAKKSQLSDIRSAIDAMPGRPAEIRARVTELSGLASQLDAQLETKDKAGVKAGNSEATLWLTQAQAASVAAEKAALEEELLSQPMRLELLKAQLDQTSHDIAELEKRGRAMALRAGELRQGEAASAQAAADKVLADARGKPPVVRQLADRNVELTKSFSERGANIEQVDHQETTTRNSADRLETDLTAIERKLELLGMSMAVGEILRERQAQLPAQSEIARDVSNNADEIRASSLRQVELEDERRLLRNRTEYVNQLVQGLPEHVAEQVRGDLDALVDSRRELVRKAIELESSYAQALGDLDFSLRRYSMAVDAYRQFISERLLWIPSRDKFALFHGQGADLVKQVQNLLVPGRWLTVARNMPGEMLSQPFTFASLLGVLLLVYFGPRLRRQLTETGKHVGYVRSDRFSGTLQALGLSLLLSLKWPMLMVTVAWLFELQDEESELATALYTAFFRGTLYLWGLEFLRMTLLPKGLVDMHFRWPANRVSHISRNIVSMERTFLPAAMLVIFCLSLYSRDVGGALGTVAVILVLLSLANFFRQLPEFVQSKMQMMFSDRQVEENPLWGKLIRSLLFWIPIAAILAVFLGYSFTAIEIALLLIRTFVLLSCLLILHELGLRWLGLTRRRMAFEVRQELARASAEEGEVSVEEEILENDPELLSYEGTKLLNLLVLFAGLFGVAWIWSEVFPALGILDSVSLWQQTAVVDGREVAAPVTLADLVRALLLATVGWVALRRMPGLLEIFLRQRVKLPAASAYALTRVFQYAATTLLVLVVVGALGGSWSSMQWAVAALSLGIGFGLQEIVANFISGLIILFEQPIRLGDVVTVGDVSGTVTRIQMRATTIRDFDRRELLVPNKEFITSQLLNWSLSDPVTRRMIQVGVAYGTDMDEAIAIVRDVARKHPLVMADPECLVTFEEFGDNSLLISLRYFIESLDQRLKVDSELRLAINRRFNEAGIVVAFPQRDIHIDTASPLEIKMVDSGSAE
ncbi:MAG: mechanosensitive ion channel [Halioglobus sp.]